ncbi:MAG: hypothetical protein FWF50_03985 [Defluviitaleaceae bacterium]|nr:hypothetical protein [Defluviitaleaceae bacterium]
MDLKNMYAGMVNSPETFLVFAISDIDTEIVVHNVSFIPNPPNLLTIGGNNINAETVRVTEINGNTLTVERGFQGNARPWESGAVIFRSFTAYDHDTFIENIETIDNELKQLDDTITETQNTLNNLNIPNIRTAQVNSSTVAQMNMGNTVMNFATFLTNTGGDFNNFTTVGRFQLAMTLAEFNSILNRPNITSAGIGGTLRIFIDVLTLRTNSLLQTIFIAGGNNPTTARKFERYRHSGAWSMNWTSIYSDEQARAKTLELENRIENLREELQTEINTRRGTLQFDYTPETRNIDLWQSLTTLNLAINNTNPLITENMTSTVTIFHDGYIYIGGSGSSGAETSFRRFDTEKRYFERLPPMPANPLGGLLREHEGFLYLFGCAVTPFNRVWRYSIENEEWQELEPHPLADIRLASGGFINGLFYLTGTTTAPNTLRAYDPIANIWLDELAPNGMTTPNNSTSCIFDNMLYVFNTTTVNDNRKYDPITDTWENISALPSPSASNNGMAFVLNEQIYLTRRGTAAQSFLKRFDPETETWAALTQPNWTTTGGSYAANESELFQMGGTSRPSQVSSILVSDIIANWPIIGHVVAALNNPVANCINDEVYLMGTAVNPAGQLISYNIENDTWQMKATANQDLRNAVTFIYGDKLYTLGGTAQQTAFSVYNPQNNTWETLPNSPAPILRPAGAIIHNENVFIISANNIFIKYNFAMNSWAMLPNLPFASGHITAQKIGSRIYTVIHNAVWLYDIDLQTWRQDTSTALPVQTDTISGTLGTGVWAATASTVTINNPTSTLNDDFMYITPPTTTITNVLTPANRLIRYNPKTRTGNRTASAPLSIVGGIVMDYNNPPYTKGDSLLIFINNQILQYQVAEMSEQTERRILAEVTEGQSIFYETAHEDIYLTLNGNKIPHGKSIAEESGFLILAYDKVRSNTFIKGWVI